MSVIYCMIESRNDIDYLWETVAGLICIDVSEAQVLVDTYKSKQFDIDEYRVRECTKVEYENTPCPVRMFSPGATEEDDE